MANVRGNEDLPSFVGQVFQRLTTGASTINTSDSGVVVEVESATPVNVTVPRMKQGTVVLVMQTGAGQITFVPASGVTLVNVDSNTRTAGQWAAVYLYWRTETQVVLLGSTGEEAA